MGCWQPSIRTEQDPMLRNALHLIIFVLGLSAALWIGFGYIGHHAVGAAVAFLIAGCYCVGAMELLQFHRATRRLAIAVADAASARDDLGNWLLRLPEGLRTGARLRIEGSRATLPGPALTPYLVGLLVLLGMLGTLLGMMATLRGTGVALQSATDLAAIRGSLASPVEGLAVAFGTSIAGVATSAMLGLLSALLRRERHAVVLALDLRIGSDLQAHGPAWQRTESLRLLQGQSDLLPTLVQQMHALVESVRQANQDSHAQLDARQDAFLIRHEQTQQQLTRQIQSVVDGMQQASAASHDQLATRQEAFLARNAEAQVQLADALSASLDRAVTRGSEAIASALQPLLRETLSHLEATATRTQTSVSAAVQQQLDGVQTAIDRISSEADRRADSALQGQQQASRALVDALRGSHDEAIERQQQRNEELLQQIDARQREQQQLLGSEWSALAERQQQALAAVTEHASQSAQASLLAQQQLVRETLADLQQRQETLIERAGEGDAARLAQWSATFTTITEQTALRWEHASAQTREQQQQIIAALEAAARGISEEARAQSSATITEIARLLETASEAPRAAADVVAELRQRLSDSLVRDTALLEERAQLLGTLGTLMESIQSASLAQRGAVDDLISNAQGLMARTGEHFAEQVDAQAQTLQAVITGVNDAAAGTRALASGLEGAVTTFADSSTSLSAHLQQLAGALDASLARSDEQLAYYVAQAREVVDLSLLSQKQITEELRQLGDARGAAGSA